MLAQVCVSMCVYACVRVYACIWVRMRQTCTCMSVFLHLPCFVVFGSAPSGFVRAFWLELWAAAVAATEGGGDTPVQVVQEVTRAVKSFITPLLRSSALQCVCVCVSVCVRVSECVFVCKCECV
jgi:hypothetical protein